MDENEPVEDIEFVFRRIHATFFDDTMPIPIREPAFRPTANDTTGLSVFRARFASPPDILNIDPAKARKYYVARLAMLDLRNIGFSVVPQPEPAGPAGHAVIPQLNWQSYQANKRHWKPLLVELAKLASADIVHRPS